MTWAHDLIVLTSVALSAMALNVMARTQLAVSPEYSALLAVGVLVVGAIGHIIARRRVEISNVPVARHAPAPSVLPHANEPHHEHARTATEVHPHEAPPHEPAPQVHAQTAADQPIEDEATRIANLQALITELARTVPGPRASTPDPDAVAHPTPSTATEQQHAALTAAAAAMRGAITPDLHQERSLADEIAASLASNRIATYLQPIQALGKQQPQHYELSIRLRDAEGRELPQDDVKEEARRHGLLPLIDAALLPRAARVATHLHNRGRRSDILSPVNAVSITESEFRSGLDVALASAPAATLVLTFAQSDVRHFVPAHWQALAAMAHMGCRFAIEQVYDLDMDFETLKAHGFDFIKLDAEVLLAGLPSPSGLISPDDLCRYLATIGYAIIVGHIDDDMTCARLLGFGALFGQGQLFGGKRAVRADAINTGAAAA